MENKKHYIFLDKFDIIQDGDEYIDSGCFVWRSTAFAERYTVTQLEQRNGTIVSVRRPIKENT